MTTDRGALAALLATMTVLTFAIPAMAQTEQTAPVRGLEGLANPAPQTTTIPIPDTPKIALPTETPAPRRAARPRAKDESAPEKTTADRPAARDEQQIRQTRPSTTATRSPATEPAPVTTRTPETVSPPPAQDVAPTDTQPAAPQTAPSPQPAVEQPVPAPAPVTPAESTVSAPETGRAMPLWLSLAAIVVVLGALWALRRTPRGRRQDRIEAERVVEPIAPPAPEPVAPAPVSAPAEPAITPVAPAAALHAVAVAGPQFLEPRAKTPAAAPRARLTCDLRPLRAGLNMLSATVECELVVTNTGTVPATAIRTGVALLTAHAGQDTDLAQFNASPVSRPAAPPFALAPGETRTIRTVVAIAREAIQTMTAANRPMFVPVVATNILYATAGDDAQTARAWVIGIERVDSAKLAPFWLDGPAKMHTSVAARPHAATFDR
ncbi:hypothetical protein QP162_13970 [Sphingomonas aurantiaca]|uniref:Uncharacterized protein n=1 Tax=Sphingomonas aurantiaca TaxID=185949 RepID=A0A2T5GP07_9SPHN|nr:hypothetical protein [Sphingomonas aurantiaca]PTQ61059.1 hypothetical protein C8J26_1377 [Sphingomonas aurantiaca]